MRSLRSQKRSFAVTSVLLILVFAGMALGQGSDGDIRQQAAQVTEFEVNGLKVLVKRRPTSATVAAGLFIKGGALNITAENSGIESLMLETAAEASARYPREALRRELAATGSNIGAAVTSDYSVLSMGSTKQHFGRTWNLFADVAMNPRFDPADVERVKDRLMTGLREQETDNDNFLEILQERLVYRGHPYSVDVNGTLQTMPGFEVKDLRDFHGQLMQTTRLLLVVVGDVEPNEFKGWIEKSLALLPRGDYDAVAVPAVKIPKPALDIVRRPIPTNYIQGVFSAPGIDHPDYYPMKIAISILQARVYQKVRVERQLSYAPNAELNARAANTGTIYVTTVDPNESVKLMLAEMDNLRNGLIYEEVLSSISGYFLTQHYMDQQTNATQAGELAKYELVGGGWRNSFEFLSKIKAVTPLQVRDVANRYFNNIHFIVIGDPALVDRKIFLREG